VSLAINLASWTALAPAAQIDTIQTDARGMHACLVALGDECERLASASPSDALTAGETLANVARTLGAQSAAARALRATIPALAYQGKLEESIARAELAANTAIAADDSIEAARARVASLHALTKLGRTTDALKTGASARDALVAAGRPDLAARAELNIANIHKVRGETSQALSALERALSSIPDGDGNARGITFNSLGETLLQLDRFDESEQAFRNANELLTAQPLARAIVAGNLADLLARQGRVGEALRIFDEAARATKDVAPGHHARLEIDRAEALVAIGAFAEALDATTRALEVAAAKGLKSESARGTLVLARALLAAGRTTEAQHAQARAAAIIEESGDLRGHRAAALLASELAWTTGDASRAIDCAIEAGATNTSLAGESPLDVAHADLRLARAQLLTEDTLGAAKTAELSLDAARRLGVKTIELDALLVSADVARTQHGVAAAIEKLSQAVEIAESTRATLGADSHRAAYASLSLRAYEDLALDFLALGLDRGDRAELARAFETTERARSRTLLDTMLRAVDRALDRSPDRPVESETARQLASLRARLSALHATPVRTDDAHTGTGERRASSQPTTLSEIAATERAIDDVLTRLETARGVRSLLNAPLTTEEVLARVAPNEVLLSYFAAGDELIAFVAQRGELRCLRALASMTDITTLVDKLLFLLRSGARAGDASAEHRNIDALSRALYRTIIEPVLQLSNDLDQVQRLVIVPCGALHALPFALLDDGKRPLIARFEIQVAPSASIACGHFEEVDRTTTQAAVVAFADHNAPLISEEAERIAHLYGVQPLIGSAATRANLGDAITNAQIVHLACHGRFVPALPSASGLRLADGWISMRDIVDLRLNTEVVVLSGCETGRHAIDAGEELSGLTRAFHAAGARRLVTTLWSVRDAAALMIADRFHADFRAGARASAALRASILALRHETPHPSWWAPFVVSGVL
jgi:CHAT domain-containing protein/tetratricopeptide (TPR) repeat protein